MMRQSRYWLPNAQHSLEVLWAVFESAAWALLSSTQRLQVMVAVTLQVAANWQYNNGRAARGRDEAMERIQTGLRAGASEEMRRSLERVEEEVQLRLQGFRREVEEEDEGEGAEEEEEFEEEEAEPE